MEYHGYNLYCPEHGYKSAIWSIDPPVTKKIRKYALSRQTEYSLEQHADCGTVTYYERSSADNQEDLDKHLKESYQKHDKFKPIPIKCVYCKETVMELIEPVSEGEITEPSSFRGVEPYKPPGNGDAIVCPNCDEEFGSSLSLAIGLGPI